MTWYKDKSYLSLEHFDKESEVSKLTKKIAMYIFLTLLILFPISMYYLSKTYVDLSSGCKINIKKNVVTGSEKYIKPAIKKIKMENPTAYRVLCQNIDTIYERQCFTAYDDKPKIKSLSQDGCYIKGTHSIFINPAEKTNDLIEKRAVTIIKYSEIAQKYWSKKYLD